VSKAKGFTFPALAFGAISVANWPIYTRLPLFLVERFHLSLTNAGFTATFYVQVASYVGMLLSGVLVDRLAVR
jgi:MFS transporter, Spinster family, sphingosine-1-phosphate transporter